MDILCVVSALFLIIMFLFGYDSWKHIHFLPFIGLFPFWRRLFLYWKTQEQIDKAVEWWVYQFTIKKIFREFWKWYFVTLIWSINWKEIKLKEPVEVEDFLWIQKNFKKGDKLPVFIDLKNSDNSYLDVNAIRKQNPNAISVDKYEEDDYHIGNLLPFHKYVSMIWKIFSLIWVIALIGFFYLPNVEEFSWLLMFCISFWLIIGIPFLIVDKKIATLKAKKWL